MVLLHVTVHSCKDLVYPKRNPAHMVIPASSTFVEVTCGMRKWRTRTAANSAFPTWNEVLYMSVDDYFFNSSGMLHVAVKCVNPSHGVVQLGSTSIPLDGLKRGIPQTRWHTLGHTRDVTRTTSLQLGLLLVCASLEGIPQKMPIAAESAASSVTFHQSPRTACKQHNIKSPFQSSTSSSLRARPSAVTFVEGFATPDIVSPRSTGLTSPELSSSVGSLETPLTFSLPPILASAGSIGIPLFPSKGNWCLPTGITSARRY